MIIQWILNYVRRFQLCSWLMLGRWIILSLDCTVRLLRGVKAKTQKNFKRAMLFHWVCMTGTELAYLQITKLANFLILLTLVYLQREYKIRNIKSWKAPGAWSQEEELTKPCEVRIQWGGVCVPFWSLSSSFVRLVDAEVHSHVMSISWKWVFLKTQRLLWEFLSRHSGITYKAHVWKIFRVAPFFLTVLFSGRNW